MLTIIRYRTCFFLVDQILHKLHKIKHIAQQSLMDGYKTNR